jgi:hypothetical protein
MHYEKLTSTVRKNWTSQQAGLEVETLKWQESEGKGLDDYLKSRLTECSYHITGKERAFIQQEVLHEVGWGEAAIAHAHDLKSISSEMPGRN